ncbi:MAG: hypothetical protein KDC53_15810 [Saprospiraceae bacterium]|nr:hypothetical protein [Saprospiraceae bacterium]
MKNLWCFLILLPYALLAQDSGHKDFPNLGISFDIPSGWVGQENESGYLMGSYTDAGIILMMPHQTKDLQQLRNEARQGVADNQGTNLTPIGDIADFHTTGIQASYQGTVSYQPAKAYAVGLVNAYGTGVTIIAMTTAEQYSQKYEQIVKDVASTVKFSKVEVKESKSGWSELLQNARLTYMHSYNSGSGSYGGYSTGGGYSDQEQIDLCAKGYFKYSSSSSMSFDTGGGFGSSHDSDQGAGTWTVVTNPQGQDILQLSFHNGQVYEYTLSLEDNKTFLNGKRYFRTYGTVTNDGPDCF